MSERQVPPRPPFTTPAQLQRANEKLRANPVKPMTKEQWREYLAGELPIRDIPEAWEQ